jgi:hypothetical protein
MRPRYIVLGRPGFLPRIETRQAAPVVAAALIRPACVFWTGCPAVNLARGPRPVLPLNPPAVLNAVAQLVNVKTPGLARSYAGPVARAAPGGPVAVVPGAQLFATR